MHMKEVKERNIHAWCLYDWANSAFATTIIAGILPIYFATVIVPPDGWTLKLYGMSIVTNAATMWAFLAGITALFVFITMPTLGAIADYSGTKKKFLMVFCYGGSLFTSLLYFCGSGDVWMTMILFFFANASFTSANIFYDAFLPQIVSKSEIDLVSGKGYAYGYLGGGLQFLICLALILGHEKIGISKSLAVRLGLLFSGIWWAGFATITFFGLRESKPIQSPLKNPYKFMLWYYFRQGISHTFTTACSLKRYRDQVLFLIAFMFYNDGIYTVIRMATIFGKDELNLRDEVLLGTLLLVQFIGIGGAVLFSRFALSFGAKRVLIFVLFLWTGILCYAYFINSSVDFLLLGIAVGLVLGGSQAISRSMYGSMIPKESSAEFFGFYSVFEKFSAIWGPFVFGIIRQVTGSSRLSILSLGGFFITGIVILCFVREKRDNSL
ncbi:MAG: MFS transporter [Candidatus Scalindua sp. AMX11]|nr:MAG: MFS transporter [Candidatus Scalindua sp.]NOG83580.1 MFS transporter [Planctomycetota bacterium]RZV70918.1 MAG: MFS transporter [Candidatus Scalindua sp. SCAELEC01]TDE64260.1 MAG: MFS transporter [Candidatus Scalindua sp. AMX11]